MALSPMPIQEIESHILHAEYENRLNRLKRDFIILQAHTHTDSIEHATKQADYVAALSSLREFTRQHQQTLDIRRCSSLFAVPTQPLSPEQRVIHRAWMGGPLPASSREAIQQWEVACEEVYQQAGGPHYQGILWVWDAKQLQQDPHFIPSGGAGRYTLGRYEIGPYSQHVNSLHQLAQDFAGDNLTIVCKLHENGYYATLSDYFRFLMVIHFGGIYMDSDTIPHRTATLFLAKPEIPDFQHHATPLEGGSIQPYHLSWMNLFLDETGLIVANKGNPALQAIMAYINGYYQHIPRDVPPRNKPFELAIFDELYKEWKQHIDRTFISHDALTQSYSAFFQEQAEPVLCGIKGMRLLIDIITDIELPLSADEQQSYDQCIAALEARDWTLTDPFELEQIAEVFHRHEIPRMAYPPQLRSDIDHYHYYNVLSADDALDRVNGLFSDYLLAHNRRAIELGHYWHPLTPASISAQPSHPASPSTSEVLPHSPSLLAHPVVKFTPGEQVPPAEHRQMAELIFETSYLEYCSAGNKLGLDLTSLQQKQNIEPYLRLIHGIYDHSQQFAGFYMAGSTTQFDDIQTEYYYRDEMKAIDDAYDAFVEQHLGAHDYFLSCVALHASHRGQGIFNQILARVKKAARAEGCQRIILTVYENSDALPLYLHKGFQPIDTFDYVYGTFFDRVQLLIYPLD